TAVQERLRAAEIAQARAETAAVEERKRGVLAEAKAVAEEKRATAERRRRRATLLMAASLLLLGAGAAAVARGYQRQEAPRAADAAERRSTTDRDATAALGAARLLREEGLKQVDDPERWRLTVSMAGSALKRAEDVLRPEDVTGSLREQVAA